MLFTCSILYTRRQKRMWHMERSCALCVLLVNHIYSISTVGNKTNKTRASYQAARTAGSECLSRLLLPRTRHTLQNGRRCCKRSGGRYSWTLGLACPKKQQSNTMTQYNQTSKKKKSKNKCEIHK